MWTNLVLFVQFCKLSEKLSIAAFLGTCPIAHLSLKCSRTCCFFFFSYLLINYRNNTTYCLVLDTSSAFPVAAYSPLVGVSYAVVSPVLQRIVHMNST